MSDEALQRRIAGLLLRTDGCRSRLWQRQATGGRQTSQNRGGREAVGCRGCGLRLEDDLDVGQGGARRDVWVTVCRVLAAVMWDRGELECGWGFFSVGDVIRRWGGVVGYCFFPRATWLGVRLV